MTKTVARSIHFLTGARSEYDILAPVARRLALRAGVEVRFIPAAAQLSPFHGYGVQHIRRDGFQIAGEVESLLSSESWSGRSLSFANLVAGLTRLLSGSERSDILCVAGDREEALAGALVGNFLGIPVAHLFGGDRCIASDVDEVFRPAISKLAHLHFTATGGHRERLIRMGESAELVWTTGATSLDSLRETPEVGPRELNAALGIDVDKPFVMVIYHPSPLLSTQVAGQEMAELLRGVLALGCPVLCSYPNTDPGNVAVRDAIDVAKRQDPRLIVYHNLPRDQFVSLYRRCAALVGNSSSIVIESGFLKVPGVLVGARQDLRERGINVLRVEPEAGAVTEACLRAMTDHDFLMATRKAPSLYGDGYSGERVAELLAEIPLAPGLLRKTITY